MIDTSSLFVYSDKRKSNIRFMNLQIPRAFLELHSLNTILISNWLKWKKNTYELIVINETRELTQPF